MKNQAVIGLTAALLLSTTPALADDIEIITTGAKPDQSGGGGTTSNIRKVRTIGGTTYGYIYNESETTGAFVSIQIDTSSDGGVTWSGSPKTVLTAADLAGKGPDPNDDYTLSQLRAQKWISCPGTGKEVILTKRHGVDSNGDTIVKKELLRAVITDPSKAPDDPYTDSIIIDRPYGYSSGDLGTHIENNKLYLISAATDEDRINIIEMTSDCTDVAPGAGPLASLQWTLDGTTTVDRREAPSFFKDNGTYFLFTSGKTSWKPNQQKYSHASALSGPWSDLIDVGDETGFHSQLFSTTRITATNGSGTQARIFSGTRNAQMWAGSDSRKVWTPLYQNTPTGFATNYYDQLHINHTQGTVQGVQLDHGTKLAIASAGLVGYTESVSATHDGDYSTTWYNGNDPTKTSVTYTLGYPQLIKAVKVSKYDGNPDPTKRVQEIAISVDGVQVWQDILPSMYWTQSLDIPDTVGSEVTISLIEGWIEDGTKTRDHFGMREVEIWGEDADGAPVLDLDFSGETVGQAPSGWTTYPGANATAEIISDSGNKKIELLDNNASTKVRIVRSLGVLSGSEVTVEADLTFGAVQNGEYLRLLSDGTMAFNVTSDQSQSQLAFSDASFKSTRFHPITAGQVYTLKLVINADAGIVDIYVDGSLVWGGAPYATRLPTITDIEFGTNKASYGDLTIDNLRVEAPSKTYELVADFETGASGWSQQVGSWSVVSDDTQAYQSGAGNAVAHVGNTSWTDYTVSAAVKRNGNAAGLLGRRSGNNTYYQLQITNGDEFFLQKSVGGNWTTLASGVFANGYGDLHQLKMSFDGNTIVASINGDEVASVTDSSISAGNVGLRSVGGSSTYDGVVVALAP